MELYLLIGLETKERVRLKHGSADLLVNGRKWVQFLHGQGIVKGDKIGKAVSLPEWIFESEIMRKGALRGLFDTDGCVYRHSYLVNGVFYQYPKLALTSYSLKIRKQFFELLSGFRFDPKEYGNRIRLYSQEQTLRFLLEIGTNNPWHRHRFEEFCEDLELEQLCLT